MAKSRLLGALLVVGVICAITGTSFAKTAKSCAFNGNYSFYFWNPASNAAGVGFLSVNCAGQVLPGGIINCNFEGGDESESFIEGGAVFLEKDGAGTMLIETEGSGGICLTGTNALELDISVVLGGKTVLFNSDGEKDAGSGVIPQAGYYVSLTGRADKCFAGQLKAGCYDFGFLTPAEANVGDCSVCVNGAGLVTGGSCRCNSYGAEYISEIEAGGYTLGENCQSSTGYMWFTTSSDEICGTQSAVAVDFAVADDGDEIIGACDPAEYIVGSSSLLNAGYDTACAFEGWLQ